MPYIRSILINGTEVSNPGSTTLADFPVLICGVYPWLATVANSGFVTSSSGYDIYFTSDAGGANLIPFERVAWDPATGAVEFWVLASSLTPNAGWPATGDTIYIVYGDPSITTDQQNRNGVWDADYVAVYHFGDGTTLDVSDSTMYVNNGVNSGASAGAGLLGIGITPTTFFGGSAVFGGADTIQVPASSSLDITGPLTIENHQKYSASFVAGNNWEIVYKVGTLPNVGYRLRLQNDAIPSATGIPYLGLLDAGFQQTPGNISANDPVDTATWDGSTWDDIDTAISWVPNGFSSVQGRLNGVQTPLTTPAIGSTSADLYIGSDGAGGDFYIGTLDEIRISRIARSADWLATAWASSSNPGSYTAGCGKATFNSDWFYLIGPPSFIPTPTPSGLGNYVY